MSEEPPRKKQKRDYTFNVNLALDKEHEVKSFKAVIELPPSALQGLAPKADEMLGKMGITTVKQLGSWKYFIAARAIVALAATEEPGKRAAACEMNLNKALDKEYETKSLKELVDAPLSAFEGLASWVDDHLAAAGLKSVSDLANWKYARWAEAMVELSVYETEDHSS
eukprot:NODE_5679_length_683_cov_43.424460_g5656_i0.p1 GENE.NODE_5679_length_683_cov_43.424460_g5656_i0~~NODE_5679_length_683_cov_43.424460_g5656_i0.p1  ORF type:complete len:168 (-),score=46.70 NODE_5679_length_683_cov_43.424460_g5656_i0:108-611(-)